MKMISVDISLTGKYHIAKIRAGYAGGKAPIGYKECRGSKALTLDEEKASTVMQVFELRDEKPNASLKKLADILNSEGYTTKENASRFMPCR